VTARGDGSRLAPTADEILARASRAFDVARATPSARLASWIDAVSHTLEASREVLVDIADDETSLGRARLDSELSRTTSQLAGFAEAVREDRLGFPPIATSRGDSSPHLNRIMVPLGPVAVWAASNFPFAFSIVGGDTASAWAARCPVIVKAHSGHPRLSREVFRLARHALDRSNAPADFLQMIDDRRLAEAVLVHSSTAAGAFTGSTGVGRHLFDLAVSRPDPIPFYGELGSVNPVVLTHDAFIARGEEFAVGFVDSLTLGKGQFCTKPGVVLSTDGVELAAFIGRAAADRALGRLLTPNIEDAFHQAMGSIENEEGVVTVRPARLADGSWSAGFSLVEAALVVHKPELIREERFGPHALIVSCSSDNEVLEVLEVMDGMLVGCIHSQSLDGPGVRDIVDILVRKSGRVVWNGWPTGVAVAPEMQHGGPYPSSTSALFTSVGLDAVRRFLRPVVLQDFPEPLR